MLPWREIIFAYVLGFIVYVLITLALLPVHLLLKRLSAAGDWNERWEIATECCAAFCAGTACYFCSPDMGYMTDATVAIALALTFFISDARKLAYGAIRTANLVANQLGFVVSIATLFIYYHRT